MKKILMISYFAPPLLSAESILVAKILPSLAEFYHIDLVTVENDWDYKRDEQLLQYMQHENLHMFRYKNPLFRAKVLRRLVQHGLSTFTERNGFWTRNVIRQHGKRVDAAAYDLIYSRFQPGASHLAALAFKRRWGIPWVAQFSDPWAFNPYHESRRADQQAEKEVMQAADRYIFPTKEMGELFASHYPSLPVRERSRIIPHCFAPSLYHTTRNEGKKDALILAYVGDFYGIRSPEPLLKALTLIEQRAPDLLRGVVVRVIGNVETKFLPFIDTYRKRGMVSLELVGQVPYMQSLELMAASDLLLLIDAPIRVNLFLPSKLIDYFGARKPLLGITAERGTAGRLVREYGFPVCDPQDIEGIATQLTEMLQHLPAYQHRAVHNDYERFSVDAVVRELTDVFASLLERKKQTVCP